MLAIILGVFLLTGALIWTMYRLAASVERAKSDPKYLRRRLTRIAILYGVVAIIVITEAITKNEPIWVLLGLPVLLIAYHLLKSALRVKIPPA